MMNTVNLDYLILFILLIYGVFLLWITSKIRFIYSRNQSMFEIRIGDEVPKKAVKQLKAANVSKGAVHELMFVLFIETNCSVCKGVLESLAGDDRTYLEKILIVNGNETESDARILKLIKETPVFYIKNEKMINSLNIKSVPQVMLIDSAYKVVYRDVIPSGERLKMIMRDFSKMNGKVKEA
jgi:hypothetical protein